MGGFSFLSFVGGMNTARWRGGGYAVSDGGGMCIETFSLNPFINRVNGEKSETHTSKAKTVYVNDVAKRAQKYTTASH